MLKYSNLTEVFKSEAYFLDMVLIRAMLIILEAIYISSLNSRLIRPSFSHKSALQDVKLKLKDST